MSQKTSEATWGSPISAWSDMRPPAPKFTDKDVPDQKGKVSSISYRKLRTSADQTHRSLS